MGQENVDRPRWIVAATSAELGKTPVRAAAGAAHVVLFRRSDGSVAALLDRCPHYDLELSSGVVVGDDIECGYHGLRFDGAGQCTGMPARADPPAHFKVTPYAAVERDGEILVWSGSAETADLAQLPASAAR